MKKSLVLAMAMALGVTASAYAANPFSDVPAGHWAYDSIDKLAAAGVIDGMGDGTYQGAKTMTRYEMAQIVAKAMAKGAADLEKLQAEFAEELNNLGVRVAALEKKADNVTITGQIRYENVDVKNNGSKDRHNVHRLRTRLFLNGQINEDWAYHARIENNANFAGANSGQGGADLKLNQAYVTGKIGGVKVSAGRTPLAYAQSFVLDDQIDGVVATYGKSTQIKAWAGDLNGDSLGTDSVAHAWTWDKKKGYYDKTTDVTTVGANGHTWGLEVAHKFGVVDASVGYGSFEHERYASIKERKIFDIALAAPVAKDLKASVLFVHSNAKQKIDGAKKNGFTIGLNYKGASAAKVGSWGLSAKYYRVGAENWVVATDKIDSETDQYMTEGFKGFAVGANYTVAKNMVASIDYADVKGRVSGNKTKQLWSRLQLTF